MYIMESFTRSFLIIVLALTLVGYNSAANSASELQSSSDRAALPTTDDSNLKADVVFRGLQSPTAMAFLGRNDILVLEKNNGTVQSIPSAQSSCR